MTDLENGTFVPAKSRGKRKKLGLVPRHDFRSLSELFLTEHRRVKGQSSANTYAGRLRHVLDFAELAENRRRWPKAADIDRAFALELGTFLAARDVTRNGHPGGVLRKMSPKMVRLCLEATRAVVCWGRRADVRQLPPEFVNPFTAEVIGPKPTKNPLRPNPLPLAARIRIVQAMDQWQLLHLTPLLILPVRFEDVAGALISDFDLPQATWHLGSRFNGADFNKGRVDVDMPLPPVLVQLLQVTAGARSEGPMFRSRRHYSGQRRACFEFGSRADFDTLYQQRLQQLDHGLHCDRDRKEFVRELINECGSLTTGAIGKNLKTLYARVGLDPGIRPYESRSAISTEMNMAGMRFLEQRYLTLHSVSDIMNEYVTLDPVGEMVKYFDQSAPLFEAIRARAAALGLMNFGTDSACRSAEPRVGSDAIACSSC